jgi:hypothetical protein
MDVVEKVMMYLYPEPQSDPDYCHGSIIGEKLEEMSTHVIDV